MKKIISLVLVLVLALTAIGGTLAYFTDTASAENVFTIGNIDIELIETEDDGTTPFEQNKELLPGSTEAKEVYVNNVGKNDAYVEVTIEIPADMIGTFGTMTDWEIEAGTINGGKAVGPQTIVLRKMMTAGEESAILLDKITLSGEVTETTAKAEYIVPVSVKAIQTAGFEDNADSAYAELATIELATAADTATKANDALKSTGASVQLSANLTSQEAIVMTGAATVLDGNNNTIHKKADTSNPTNAGIAPNGGGIIKNVTVTGETYATADGTTRGFRAVYTNSALASDLRLQNVNLTGTYGINIGSGNGKTMNVVGSKDNMTEIDGWVSFSGLKVANFDYVDFKTASDKTATDSDGNTVYINSIRTYDDANFSNCKFAAGYYFSTDPAQQDLVTITFDDNCFVGAEKLTAVNFKSLLDGKNAIDWNLVTVIVNGIKVA